ncbi:hypothetical protein FNYG_10071 [Fusarium nygamai]|uniref:Uncharacterized protein n=1 Tax=Gibberella nygamai TaxID=42673 RepID=A0A2K0W303_GIBNY|nr:hypothetical protein FNYG_10071 [Fusarium nygamai]
MNAQMVFGPGLVQPKDQRPEVATKDGKEAAAPDRNVADKVSSTVIETE